jgi:hypothetical protein
MKSFTKKMGCFIILVSLLLTGTAMKVQAKTIISDYFWVFDQDHNVQYSTYITKAQEEINGAGTIYFLEVPGIANPNQWGLYTSVMKAPDYQVMSDAFGVICRNGEYLLFFLSDTSTEPCPYPLGPNMVYEHLLPTGRYGGMFDATRYLDPDLVNRGWTATFESGLPVSSIPEPATFLLLGSGVGILALLKRRSKLQ